MRVINDILLLIMGL